MLLKPVWILKDKRSWKAPTSDHFFWLFQRCYLLLFSLWDQCTLGVISETFREPTIIRWVLGLKKLSFVLSGSFPRVFFIGSKPKEINYREGLIREDNSCLRYSVYHCSEYSYSICFTTHSWMPIFILCVWCHTFNPVVILFSETK